VEAVVPGRERDSLVDVPKYDLPPANDLTFRNLIDLPAGTDARILRALRSFGE
jgi:hypothetical protein